MSIITIVGRARSGTNVLRNYLVRHGAIDAGEILHGTLNEPTRFFSYVEAKIKVDPSYAAPMKMIELFSPFVKNLEHNAGDHPLLIDIKYDQINSISSTYNVENKGNFVFSELKYLGAKYIHLNRKNKLRSLVSQLIAQKTGVWGIDDAAYRPHNRSVASINVGSIVDELRQMEEDTRNVRNLLISCDPFFYEVTYENMFGPNQFFDPAVVNLVKDLTNSTISSLEAGQARMNPEPLSELIENYEELKNRLMYTEFRWMLDS